MTYPTLPLTGTEAAVCKSMDACTLFAEVMGGIRSKHYPHVWNGITISAQAEYELKAGVRLTGVRETGT